MASSYAIREACRSSRPGRYYGGRMKPRGHSASASGRWDPDTSPSARLPLTTSRHCARWCAKNWARQRSCEKPDRAPSVLDPHADQAEQVERVGGGADDDDLEVRAL